MDIKKMFAGRRPFPLEEARVPCDLKILCLGPHPDDFDAIGITMRFFQRNGNDICLAVARTGSGVENSYCHPPTRDVKTAIREKEQRSSCRFFGLPEDHLQFLELDEDVAEDPVENQRNLSLIKACFNKIRPNLVFLPHGNDTNKGHQRVYSMFKKIAFSAGYPIAAFLTRDPKTTKMNIDAYVSFDEDDAKWKGQLLRFHDTQHRRNLNTRGKGIDDRILDVNRQIALELSLKQPYAEAFEIEFI